MTTTLYDLSVGTYLQIVGSTAGFLDKAAIHCKANNIPLNDIVAARLYPDMLPLHFQAISVAHHSMGTIKALESGISGPPSHPETDYAGIQSLINSTLDELKALDPDTINALSGGKVTFKMGEYELPFTTENYVLTFSLPNLYFHATTAYDILRSKGVPLGKMDFIGQMRMDVN